MKQHSTNKHNAKPRNTPLAEEQKAGGFTCAHCKRWVVISRFMGTANRNHCNVCLWSRHVDTEKGDRMANCRGDMQPVALTYKHEGQGRVGELMLIHSCQGCGKVSINRIAADDGEAEIMALFTTSHDLAPALRDQIQAQGIRILGPEDEPEVRRQLFGVQ